MKHLAILFMAIASLGADWPQKGDTVYVSAGLSGQQATMLIVPGLGGGKVPDLAPLDACAPVTIKKMDDEKIIARDDRNQTRIFMGEDWLPRLHRTEADCRAALEALGPPRIQSKGVRYAIVPPAIEAKH